MIQPGGGIHPLIQQNCNFTKSYFLSRFSQPSWHADFADPAPWTALCDHRADNDEEDPSSCVRFVDGRVEIALQGSGSGWFGIAQRSQAAPPVPASAPGGARLVLEYSDDALAGAGAECAVAATARLVSASPPAPATAGACGDGGGHGTPPPPPARYDTWFGVFHTGGPGRHRPRQLLGGGGGRRLLGWRERFDRWKGAMRGGADPAAAAAAVQGSAAAELAFNARRPVLTGAAGPHDAEAEAQAFADDRSYEEIWAAEDGGGSSGDRRNAATAAENAAKSPLEPRVVVDAVAGALAARAFPATAAWVGEAMGARGRHRRRRGHRRFAFGVPVLYSDRNDGEGGGGDLVDAFSVVAFCRLRQPTVGVNEGARIFFHGLRFEGNDGTSSDL